MRTELQERKFQFLKKLRKRLIKLEDKACNHCGHEEPLNDMFRYEDKIIEFVSVEMDIITDKPECPPL